MSSTRMSRLGRVAVPATAVTSSYLYTHPEQRQQFTGYLGTVAEGATTAAKKAGPILTSAFYIAPSVPKTEEEEIKYLTDFGLALDMAKEKDYGPGQRISRSESDNLLKEIFDRATYYATKKGNKTIPTTIAGAEKLYTDAQKTRMNKAKEIASTVWSGTTSGVSSVISGVKGIFSKSKPLAGGKRKARRSKRSGSKRSRRNMRSRRNRSRRN